MKRYKVFVNYESTGYLLVMAKSEDQAEAMAARLIDSKNFIAPFAPEIVDGTMQVLNDVTEED